MLMKLNGESQFGVANMKRTFVILTVSVVMILTIGEVFGRQRDTGGKAVQAPIRRTDKKVVPNLPGRRIPREIGASTTLQVIKTDKFNTDGKPFKITACTLSGGDIFIGWEAFADKAGYSYKWRAGKAGRYSVRLRQRGTDMIYTATRNSYFIEGNSSVPLANGNVLIAYNDKIDNRNEKGTFVVLSPQMKVLVGPVIFSKSRAASVSATSMLDGAAALIAYSDSESPTYQGKYLIVNAKGEITIQPKAFSYKGNVSDVSTGTTWNGKAVIAFNLSLSGWGSQSVEVDALGNMSRTLKGITYDESRITDISICPLSDKNTLVLGNWKGSAKSTLIGPDGKPVNKLNFEAIHPKPVYDIQATKLSNDNVFVSFVAPGDEAMSAVLDPAGKLIKGPMAVFEGYRVQAGLDCIAQTKLTNDMVLVITHGFRPEPHNDQITRWTVLK